MRPNMQPVAVAKIPKRSFHASNWLFAQITHVDEAPWNFSREYYPGRSYYISSFKKIGWGVSELWGRKSLFFIDLAHGLYKSLYRVAQKRIPSFIFGITSVIQHLF